VTTAPSQPSRGPSPNAIGLIRSDDGGPPRVITSNNGALPPQKKVRLTDALRKIIWEMVLVSNECCRLENEKKYVFRVIFFFLLLFFHVGILGCVLIDILLAMVVVSWKALRFACPTNR
jgi:hypothetical protein